jgi:hypothetical protein
MSDELISQRGNEDGEVIRFALGQEIDSIATRCPVKAPCQKVVKRW